VGLFDNRTRRAAIFQNVDYPLTNGPNSAARFVDYHGVYVMDRGMMFTVESDPAAQLAAP
jgi:hypothetical protein